MKLKNRIGGSPSDPIAQAGAGKGPDHQVAPAKAKGLQPISEELGGISGGRDDDARHTPPRA